MLSHSPGGERGVLLSTLWGREIQTRSSEGREVDGTQSQDLDPGLSSHTLCVLLTAGSCCLWREEATPGRGSLGKAPGADEGPPQHSPALPSTSQSQSPLHGSPSRCSPQLQQSPERLSNLLKVTQLVQHRSSGPTSNVPALKPQLWLTWSPHLHRGARGSGDKA